MKIKKMKGDLSEYTPVGWGNIWISGRYQWIPVLVGGELLQWVNLLLFRNGDTQKITLSQSIPALIQFENDMIAKLLPSALCFLLFFLLFFFWFSAVAASAVCCSLAMKFSMSSKQRLRISWERKTQFVALRDLKCQPEVSAKTRRWAGDVPLLSLLAAARHQGPRSLRSLLVKTWEDSVNPFSSLLHLWPSPWIYPLILNPFTNTQNNLCSRAFYLQQPSDFSTYSFSSR